MNTLENVKQLFADHKSFIAETNKPGWSNGIVQRYVNPVLTNKHAPVCWRYDLNPETKPLLLLSHH